jgi:hypothetical protein
MIEQPPSTTDILNPPTGANLEPEKISLDEAVDSSAPAIDPSGATPEQRAAEREALVPTDALTADDIMGIVCAAGSFGLSDEDAKSFEESFMSDRILRTGLRMSQLEKTLAKMGITLGGGELPTWLSVSLGLGVLGYGVYSHRLRFAPKPEPEPIEPPANVTMQGDSVTQLEGK